MATSASPEETEDSPNPIYTYGGASPTWLSTWEFIGETTSTAAATTVTDPRPTAATTSLTPDNPWTMMTTTTTVNDDISASETISGVTTVTVYSPSPTNTGIEANNGNNSSGLSTGAVTGVGIGVGLGVVFFVVAVILVFRRRRRKVDEDAEVIPELGEEGTPAEMGVSERSYGGIGVSGTGKKGTDGPAEIQGEEDQRYELQG